MQIIHSDVLIPYPPRLHVESSRSHTDRNTAQKKMGCLACSGGLGHAVPAKGKPFTSTWQISCKISKAG